MWDMHEIDLPNAMQFNAIQYNAMQRRRAATPAGGRPKDLCMGGEGRVNEGAPGWHAWDAGLNIMLYNAILYYTL